VSELSPKWLSEYIPKCVSDFAEIRTGARSGLQQWIGFQGSIFSR